MKPTIGRIVLYRLGYYDVQAINGLREQARETGHWHNALKHGLQAHNGNHVEQGQEVPAMIVAVWGEACVNLKLLLDGNDSHWVTSTNEGTGEGCWHWPVVTVPPMDAEIIAPAPVDTAPSAA